MRGGVRERIEGSTWNELVISFGLIAVVVRCFGDGNGPMPVRVLFAGEVRRDASTGSSGKLRRHSANVVASITQPNVLSSAQRPSTLPTKKSFLKRNASGTLGIFRPGSASKASARRLTIKAEILFAILILTPSSAVEVGPTSNWEGVN